MHKPRVEKLDKEITREKILKALTGDSKVMIKTALEIAELLKKVDVPTTQVRNIFGTVKSMEMSGFDIDRFVLLKPKIHYITSRKKELIPLGKAVSYSVDIIYDSNNREEIFKRFCSFLEAILAYHRAFQKGIYFD